MALQGLTRSLQGFVNSLQAFGGGAKYYIISGANVHIVDANFEIISSWGGSGSGDGQFLAPISIDVYNNEVYVADSSRTTTDMQVFDPLGVFVRKWKVPAVVALAPSTLIRDIDVFGDEVYTGCGGNAVDGARVVVTDTNGVFDREWGSNGTGDGEYHYLGGVAVYDNEVYTTDRGIVATVNHRVQVYNLSGTFVRKWGSYGTGDGEFYEPLGIAVFAGKVYVVDFFNDRVQIFNTAGTYISQFGTTGTNDGEFDGPGRVRIIENKVFVIDGEDRIQEFSLAGVFIRSTPLSYSPADIGLV